MNQQQDDGIKEFLKGIQLEQFYWQVRNQLHVSLLYHFDHVNEADLDGIGMAKPEQRRLFDALKKARKKSFLSSFRRKKSKKASQDQRPPTQVGLSTFYGPVSNTLTCLINEKSLELQEMLGNGAFGFVRKGVWSTDQVKKVDVAVKCLKYSADEMFVHMQAAFVKEANAMSLLDHPNIVKLYGIVLSVPMMLVLELAPLGSLLSRLRNEPHNFLISSLCDFAIQIASGMAYLESQRFIHRDLAARNILMESFEKVKIGDFGMMRALSGDEQYFTIDCESKVALAWCAPESLKFRQFSHASDVWSFGMTMMELFSYGANPWPGCHGSEILTKIDLPACERPKKPQDCPSQIYKLMLSQCWVHEPQLRPRFNALKRSLEELQPPNVKALHKYHSKIPENLNFLEGDKITLLDASCDKSWWFGQNMTTGKTGKFPAELVDSDLRPGLALSPPKFLADHLKQMKSIKQSTTSRKSLNDSKGHSYEYPVLKSPDTEDTRTLSGRSIDSDFTSSGECDSGYSSSGDRYSRSSSSGSRLSSSLANYENCAPLYEPMKPISSSEPIPIPGNGWRECSTQMRPMQPKPTNRRSSQESKLPPPLPPRNSLSKLGNDNGVESVVLSLTETTVSQTIVTRQKLCSSVSQRGKSRMHFYENQEIVSLDKPAKPEALTETGGRRESQMSYENISLPNSPKSTSPINQTTGYENWDIEDSKQIFSFAEGVLQGNPRRASYENVSPTQGMGFAVTKFSFDTKKDSACGSEQYEVMMKPSTPQNRGNHTLVDEGRSAVVNNECKEQGRSSAYIVSEMKTCSGADRLSHSAPSQCCVDQVASEMLHGQLENKMSEQHRSRKTGLAGFRSNSTGHVCTGLGVTTTEDSEGPVPPPRKNRPSRLSQTGRTQSDCSNCYPHTKSSNIVDGESAFFKTERLKAKKESDRCAGDRVKLKLGQTVCDVELSPQGDSDEKTSKTPHQVFLYENMEQIQKSSTTEGNLFLEKKQSLVQETKGIVLDCETVPASEPWSSAMNESIPVDEVPVLPPKRKESSESHTNRSNSWSTPLSNGITSSQQRSTLAGYPYSRSNSDSKPYKSEADQARLPFSHSLPSGAPVMDYRTLAATFGYDDVPPPLPKKMSRTKSPAIPPRIDLGQA